VIAPSESIAHLLADRGVTTSIQTVPTGIDTAAFAKGVGSHFRESAGIRKDATVIGHVGRLAEEKNLMFLTEAVISCLKAHPRAVFVLVGDGDARENMLSAFAEAGLGDLVHAPGKLSGSELADAYAAMDCFAFASQTETQGIVLAEAMAAGNPVVALDGPGVREIVRDGVNGHLLPADGSPEEFCAALSQTISKPAIRRTLAANARQSAKDYDSAVCTRRMLHCYASLVAVHQRDKAPDTTPWDRLVAGIEIEWELLAAKVSAVTAAVIETPATEARLD
jgi:1,2-diacylglycerol 3-alpha-glucosyltransferase